MRKLFAIAAVSVALWAVPAKSQYCPSFWRGLTHPSQGTTICTDPLGIPNGGGGGTIAICPSSHTFVRQGGCFSVAYSDLVITHTPIVGDVNPYYQYKYNLNRESAQVYGFFDAQHAFHFVTNANNYAYGY